MAGTAGRYLELQLLQSEFRTEGIQSGRMAGFSSMPLRLIRITEDYF